MIRHHHIGLEIGRLKNGQVHHATDDLHEVFDDHAETSSKRLLLGFLAAQQRDLFGIFPQPRKRKAVIGLHLLLLEVEADQGASDEVGEHCPQNSISDTDPHQQSRNGSISPRQREPAGQNPQDSNEETRVAH